MYRVLFYRDWRNSTGSRERNAQDAAKTAKECFQFPGFVMTKNRMQDIRWINVCFGETVGQLG